MSGLQSVKLTLGGSPITLISIDTDLLRECQRVLEKHFDVKSPAFSTANGDEWPVDLGPFQIAASFAVDKESPPYNEYLSPSSQNYPIEFETHAAVFTDEIDKFKFYPPSPESHGADFAPIITEVRSLNPSHVRRKRKRRAKGQPVGRLAASLRSQDTPPLLVPFDTDFVSEPPSEPAADSPSKTRPRDPLGVPETPVPTLSPPCRKPFISVLSNKQFASVTSPVTKSKPLGLSEPKKLPTASLNGVAVANEIKKRNRRRRPAKASIAKEQEVSEISPLDETISRVASEVTLTQPCVRYRCSKCKASFLSFYRFKRHQNVHQLDLKCKHCKHRFKNQRYVDLHQKVFHPEFVDPADVAPLDISDCSEEETEAEGPSTQQLADRQAGFGQEDPLLIGNEAVDLNILLPLTDESESELDRSPSPEYLPTPQHRKLAKYACPYCPMRRSDRFMLRKHILTHTAASRIECPICKKMFWNKRGCAAHVEKKHGEVWTPAEVTPSPCKGCNAVLESPLELAEHYCTTHINLALLGCGICRTVLSLTQWRTHASTHI